MNSAILLPMLPVVALTFVAFVRLAMARSAAVKAGQDAAYYRAHLGEPEPEAAVIAARHYDNMLELPLLFYVGCIVAFVLPALSSWTLIFAWFYAFARIAQSGVHLTYNNPVHRGGAFAVGVLALLGLWTLLAVAIFASF
ncbi:MAPEG family protein [soil metagenome]